MNICPQCSAHFPDDQHVCRHDGTLLVADRPKSDQGDPMVGSLFEEKYRIIERLGAGGMGAVYRAEHIIMKRDVAIKIVHNRLIDDGVRDEFLRRFQSEARTASRIKHPNAITLHDFGITNGNPYLVMEFVEGMSLKAYLKDHAPLSPAVAADLLAQICGALEEAHALTIIHRDIKPDNIMISLRRDGTPHATVLDFGLAKPLAGEGSQAQLTQSGVILGTPQYMSPEQIRGQNVDHRSDVYSIGVVLYEMLCGAAPFQSDSLTALLLKHISEPPPPVRELAPNLNIAPALEAVVLRALSKEPAERPQSAKLLAEEVARAIREGGGERRPVRWAAMISLSIVLLVAAAAAFPYLSSAYESFASAKPSPSGETPAEEATRPSAAADEALRVQAEKLKGELESVRRLLDERRVKVADRAKNAEAIFEERQTAWNANKSPERAAALTEATREKSFLKEMQGALDRAIYNSAEAKEIPSRLTLADESAARGAFGEAVGAYAELIASANSLNARSAEVIEFYAAKRRLEAKAQEWERRTAADPSRRVELELKRADLQQAISQGMTENRFADATASATELENLYTQGLAGLPPVEVAVLDNGTADPADVKPADAEPSDARGSMTERSDTRDRASTRRTNIPQAGRNPPRRRPNIELEIRRREEALRRAERQARETQERLREMNRGKEVLDALGGFFR